MQGLIATSNTFTSSEEILYFHKTQNLIEVSTGSSFDLFSTSRVLVSFHGQAGIQYGLLSWQLLAEPKATHWHYVRLNFIYEEKRNADLILYVCPWYTEGSKNIHIFKSCYLCIAFRRWIELRWLCSRTLASPGDRQDSQKWLVFILCYRYILRITILIVFFLS
jgi:hypothetical protein